jgi:2-dehydropantoate 2-reductase
MEPTNRPERVIVLGAGAIGAATGALLFEAGAPCVLVARGGHGRAIAARGVELRFPGHARCVRVPTVASAAAAVPTSRDLVVLSTMGHDAEAALAELDPAVPVVSFQNGLAPVEAIARRGHRPTLLAVLYVPVERRAPGVVAIPAVPVVGSVLVGNWPTGAGAWARWLVARLADAGFRAEIEPNLAPWARAKLLINLGGIVAALCDAPVPDVVEAARDEARAVWRAAGAPFEEIEALRSRVGLLDTAPVDGRDRRGGSTRAALARGDRLETACLHGTVVRDGHVVGVATPVNEGLIRLAGEAERERWSAGTLNPEKIRRRVLGRAPPGDAA